MVIVCQAELNEPPVDGVVDGDGEIEHHIKFCKFRQTGGFCLCSLLVGIRFNHPSKILDDNTSFAAKGPVDEV